MKNVSRDAFYLLLLAALVVIATCCGDDAHDPAKQSNEQYGQPAPGVGGLSLGNDQTPGGCPRAVVTSAMGLSWQHLNHRISLWKVMPEQNGCPENVPADVPLHIGFVGGNWSTGETLTDLPGYEYGYFAVDSPGNIRFVSMDVELWIDPPTYESSRHIVLSLPELGLSGFTKITVLLSGLTLSTDVEQIDPQYPEDYRPDLGYTSRGIGAGVRNIVKNGAVLGFDVGAKFELGLADRPDMNAAILRARTKAVVRLQIVALREGNIHCAGHGYFLEYDPPRLLGQPNYDHAPVGLREFVVQGTPGIANAFIALQSFDFKLFGSVTEGDYIRAFSVKADLLAYNPQSGQAEIDLDGFASNAGLLTYETMENDFTATLALIQFANGAARAGSISNTFETGEAEVVLPQ